MTAADRLRRGMDIVAGAVGLIVAAPLLLAAGVAIRVSMGTPILFRQRRLGQHGAPFTLLKLRSMRDAAPGREGPQFDELRLGRLGRFLRSTSIDELPSLVNLVRGDIGLVGPRPLPVHYWDRFTAEQRRRFDVRPGLTGLAQVAGRNLVDWPERLALDVRYVESRSLRLDMVLLARTVPLVLFRRGVNRGAGVTMTELPPR